MADFAQELAVARRLAAAAGELAMRHRAQPLAVTHKGNDPSNPVTDADLAANALIVAGLAAAFPADGILAEESTDARTRLSCRRLWCVDPIDGTRDYVAGSDDFVVMVGLAVDGCAELGVLYHPPSGRTQWGTPGQAFVDDATGLRPLRVSSCRDLQRATALVSRAHPARRVQALLQHMGVVRRRPLGSVGLKLGAIAAAEAELYLTAATGMGEWDVCAPEAVLRAAGGRVTDLAGAPLVYNKPRPLTLGGVLATNGPLHEACLAAVAPLLG